MEKQLNVQRIRSMVDKTNQRSKNANTLTD